MCQFLETIQLCDSQFKRLPFHQARMEKAMVDYYPHAPILSLESILMQYEFPTQGVYKCRVVYDSKIRLVEFLPYTPPVIRSLKIVETDIPCLPYKLADRTAFQEVLKKRGEANDVLLLKNGLLTDTSYCNIALWDGKNWITPRTPLVQGVNRADLLAQGILVEKDMAVQNLAHYPKIRLFNALNEFGSLEMDVAKIRK